MRMNGGNRGEMRSSALWGTGNRGGESRSNALWGKGGRGAITALLAMLAISVPLASSAVPLKHAKRSGHATIKKTWISPGLLKQGEAASERSTCGVIVQSTNGQLSPALSAFTPCQSVRGRRPRRPRPALEPDQRRLGHGAGERPAEAHADVEPDRSPPMRRCSSPTTTRRSCGRTSRARRRPGAGSNSISSWNTPTIAIVDSGIDAGPRRLRAATASRRTSTSRPCRATRPATGAATARSSPASPRARRPATRAPPRTRSSSRSTSWTTAAWRGRAT